MNTKFSFTLLAVLVVLLASLAGTTSFTKAPKSVDVSQPARPIIIPSSGIRDFPDYFQRHSDLSSVEAAGEVQAAHLWSGEVFLSDNDSPDIHGAEQDAQNACMSEDDLPRRYSGCVE